MQRRETVNFWSPPDAPISPAYACQVGALVTSVNARAAAGLARGDGAAKSGAPAETLLVDGDAVAARLLGGIERMVGAHQHRAQTL